MPDQLYCLVSLTCSTAQLIPPFPIQLAQVTPNTFSPPPLADQQRQYTYVLLLALPYMRSRKHKHKATKNGGKGGVLQNVCKVTTNWSREKLLAREDRLTCAAERLKL
jgi:hypothetical protein